MPNQPPLNPDALEAAYVAVSDESWLGATAAREIAKAAVSAYLAAALPEVNSKVEAFINQRPEYITAMESSPHVDPDYCRWQGGAGARRQLAQALGWTVPHNPGETTRPEVKP